MRSSLVNARRNPGTADVERNFWKEIDYGRNPGTNQEKSLGGEPGSSSIVAMNKGPVAPYWANPV
jgi:hypothetical protein